MEKRKYNYASCNRVDDSVLLEILRDRNESVESNRRNSCGCQADSNVRRNSNSNVPENTAQQTRYSYNRTSENGTCSRNVDNVGTRVDRYNNSSKLRSCNYNEEKYGARREESPENNGSGGCENCISNSCINKYPPAMVYCPDHEFSDLYECEEALEHGTLFRVLNLEFYPTRCNNCR